MASLFLRYSMSYQWAQLFIVIHFWPSPKKFKTHEPSDGDPLQNSLIIQALDSGVLEVSAIQNSEYSFRLLLTQS